MTRAPLSHLFGPIVVASLCFPASGQKPASAPTPSPEEQPEAKGAFEDLAKAAKALESGKGADAESLLRAVATRLPRYPNVWQQLALACRLQGKKKEAYECIEKAIGFGKPNADMHLLAAELALAGRVLGAAKHALAAVELEPKQERTLGKALDVLLEANDLKAAEQVFEKLQKATGKSVSSREKLLWRQADLANRKLKPELAVLAYRQLCELVGDRDPFPHECLANTLVVLDKPGEALAAYARCLRIHPSNLTAREREIAIMKQTKAPAEDLEREQNLLIYYRKLWELEKKAGTKPPAKPEPVRPAAPK